MVGERLKWKVTRWKDEAEAWRSGQRDEREWFEVDTKRRIRIEETEEL